jgi:dTDP-4-dehydrorhamnose 3,5-epimerase
MKFTPSSLNDVYVIDLEPLSDDRGWFARTFCKEEFAGIGHKAEWVQLNHSFTSTQGTIRGLHYQLPPFSEIKLVRCIAGKVFDVVVDIRKDSANFLKWTGVELSALNQRMIYIPEGFAHGFQALTDNCELIYHHSAFYRPGVEAGIRYDDPMLRIDWPLHATLVSERDRAHPFLTPGFKGI